MKVFFCPCFQQPSLGFVLCSEVPNGKQFFESGCWKTHGVSFLLVFSKYNLHFYLECWTLSLIVGNYKSLVCFECCEICVLRGPRCLCVILSLVDCEWCTLPFHPYSNAVHPEVSLRFRVLDNSLFEALVKRFHQELARCFRPLEVLRLEIRWNIGHPQVSGAGRPSF
jgi:hypothetical protein